MLIIPELCLEMLYTFFIWLYSLGYRLASWWNPKARQGTLGRKGNLARIKKAIDQKPGKWLWLHAASLGEFEQGRPLLEAIRKAHPEYRILVTFFSPSGYEVRKKWAGADCVAYLPFDLPWRIRALVDAVQPETVFVVKYELWLNWLKELEKRAIPTVLVAASMQPQSGYFRWPVTGMYKRALAAMAAIFTQDQETFDLLAGFSGPHNLQLSGDPRYDRTRAAREAFQPVPELADWLQEAPCLMGGSTWPEDEELLFSAFDSLRKNDPELVLVIAPHEISRDRIEFWDRRYPGQVRRWTLGPLDGGSILFVDTIGLLSRLYHYADVAYLGGGFRKGLHNILEAVAFGCPTAFGPQHANRPEAATLLREGEGCEVRSPDELTRYVRRFLEEPEEKTQASLLNRNFVDARTGATAQILAWWEGKQREPQAS